MNALLSAVTATFAEALAAGAQRAADTMPRAAWVDGRRCHVATRAPDLTTGRRARGWR